MAWEVDSDDSESVILSHDDGFLIYASKGLEKDYGFDYEFQIINTSTDEMIEHRDHPIEDDEHLWEVLDRLTEKYPTGD